MHDRPSALVGCAGGGQPEPPSAKPGVESNDSTAGITDVNRFECSEDELVLPSLSGPPLTLTRTTDR